MFFSFDGVDGVGKSTQMDLFCTWLTELGHQVVQCRDPGSTRLGEALRDIVLNTKDTPINRRAEMFIYMAARTQMVEEVILPALERGCIVVSDRFLLSTVVYQGIAGGLDVEEVWDVGLVATGGLRPNMTFVLDMDVDDAARRRNREPDRMESQGVGYLKRVRDGFLSQAAEQPDAITVIDASQSIEQVHQAIREGAAHVLA